MEPRVFYICDGKKEDCKRTNCYQNCGECKHTEDIEHAKNFCRDGIDSEKSSFFVEENRRKKEISADVKIDTTELDAALKKAKRLVELLEKAQLIINSLLPRRKS